MNDLHQLYILYINLNNKMANMNKEMVTDKKKKKRKDILLSEYFEQKKNTREY